MKVELIPVLEIPVPAETLKQVQRPRYNFQLNPDEWDEYQRQLLLAGGFAGYKRVIKGHNFVHVDQWTLPDLRRLVMNHLGNEQPLLVTESCALFGGCILFVDNVPVLVPQCCSTIADFASWKELIKPGFMSGPFCMEGHPCPQALKEGKRILIRCKDRDEEFWQPAQAEIPVELDVLAGAVGVAEFHVGKLASNIDLLSAEFGVLRASDYLVWRES